MFFLLLCAHRPLHLCWKTQEKKANLKPYYFHFIWRRRHKKPSRNVSDLIHFCHCCSERFTCGVLFFQGSLMVVRAARVWAHSPAPPPTALRLSPRVCPDRRAWISTLPPVKRGESVSCVRLPYPASMFILKYSLSVELDKYWHCVRLSLE